MIDNLYIKEVKDGVESYKPYKIDDIHIYGMSLEEAMTVLGGLELERILDIQMTMKNLNTLYKLMLEEQTKILNEAMQIQVADMFKEEE